MSPTIPSIEALKASIRGIERNDNPEVQLGFYQVAEKQLGSLGVDLAAQCYPDIAAQNRQAVGSELS